jgi:hypothetical protein
MRGHFVASLVHVLVGPFLPAPRWWLRKHWDSLTDRRRLFVFIWSGSTIDCCVVVVSSTGGAAGALIQLCALLVGWFSGLPLLADPVGDGQRNVAETALIIPIY